MIAQVVAFTLRPGIDGEIEQDVAPTEVGVCAATIPIVSDTVEGEKLRVGLATNTATFNVAVTNPVLFVAVTV